MYRCLAICLVALALPEVSGAWTIEPAAAPEIDSMGLYAAQSSVSLAQATDMALQRYPGRVVRAETVMRGGRREHNIRILGADGSVRTVRIDAQTGAFL